VVGLARSGSESARGWTPVCDCRRRPGDAGKGYVSPLGCALRRHGSGLVRQLNPDRLLEDVGLGDTVPLWHWIGDGATTFQLLIAP